MMIHLNVVGGATEFSFKVSTSPLIQSCHPPFRHMGRGAWSLFSLTLALYISVSVSLPSRVCWGPQSKTRRKEQNIFYVVGAAVIWFLAPSAQQLFNAPSRIGHIGGFFTGPVPSSSNALSDLLKHLSAPPPIPHLAINPTASHF